MKVISTRLHGALDYLTCGALLAAPRLLRLEDERASLALRAAGGAAAAYSPFTDYELALARVLPMRAHLALDAASGLALAASPWLLGFSDKGPRYWAPHALAGATELLVVALSKTR